MSSALPTTLEEMQYQILQGDLSANPKLQPSPIPAKDKELKTTAKKIIPAINELLKLIESCKVSVESYSGQIEEKVTSVTNALGDTIKSEQLEYINQQIESMKADTEQVVSDMDDTLRKAYAESVAEQFENLQKQIDELTEQKLAEKLDDINTMINEVIESKLAEQGAGSNSSGNSGAGSEGAALKRVFHSKVRLAKGDTVILPFKASEIQDINKQVDGYVYSSYRTNKFIKYSTMFADKTGSTSIWDVSTFPVDFRLDEDTDEITLVNSSNYEVMLYFFSLE